MPYTVVDMICVPIIATSNEAALKDIDEANKVADFIELRIDYIKKPNVKKLIERAKKKVIVTNRKESEGGNFKGSESSRLKLLGQAIRAGADYIDVEFSTPAKIRNSLIKKRGRSKVILSYHNFEETPFPDGLVKLFDRMNRVKGIEIIKIVTFARTVKDQMIILGFIQKVRKKKKIIAFCMGDLGRDSRVLSVPFGGYLTYGALDKNKESAPGQFTVRELRMNYAGLGVMFGRYA